MVTRANAIHLSEIHATVNKCPLGIGRRFRVVRAEWQRHQILRGRQREEWPHTPRIGAENPFAVVSYVARAFEPPKNKASEQRAGSGVSVEQQRRETMPTEYENGSRKPVTKNRPDPTDDFSQEAAANKKPAHGMGLTRPADEVNDWTHQSNVHNQRQPTPSPSTEKTSGAGPAVSEHSKDAKAPKAGRQPGAYVKD